MNARRPGPVLRRLFRVPAFLYDHDLGWAFGHRMLQLTHTGRRSGRTYRTVLEVIGIDRTNRELFVLVGFGTSSDWFRNVQAGHATEIAIGRHRFRPVHRIVDERQAVDLLADYERRNRWITPIVRWGFSWIAGWRYDGSSAARRRLARELPIVAFRPDTGA